MTRPALCAALLAASLAAQPARAASLADVYSSLIVFGDSLSDVGNVFAATGRTLPPPTITIGTTTFTGYFNGRVSNGPVWAERFTGQFAAAGRPAGNFAFALANAVTDSDTVPDLPAQLGLFSVSGLPLGPRPLAALLLGANDLFRAVDPAAATVADAEAAGLAAARAVAAGVSALEAGGVSDFLLFTLPDLGSTPAYAAFAQPKVAAATAGTQAFNTKLRRQAGLLGATGLDVTVVDLAGLFAAIVADPASNLAPCIVGSVSRQQFLSVCDPSTIAGRVFYDPVHPTAETHALIADAVEAAYRVPAPIPVPAALPLLASGLALLVVVRRRR